MSELEVLNPKQKEFLDSKQKTRVFLGGRGCGKSFTIGVSIMLKAIQMPKSKGAWVSTTYIQMKSKMIQSLKAAWRIYGLIENIDYVIAKKPPADFEIPWETPEDYKHIISFYWGSCVEMVSLERADSVRGGSYDYYEIDEAALLKEVDFKQVLLPALRGNRDKFDCISHQQVSFYTSIPWKPSGYWILNFEKKKQLQPKKYAFVEATAFDNIHILGKDGIERLREELDHLEFEVEVMNRRIKKGKFAFYDKFDPDRHTYTPRLRKGSYELYDDYDPNAYLNLSLDFGGHINFGTVWQQHGNVERCVGEFFKKGSNSLKPLIQAFCKRFEENECKQVKIWGEPRGHDAQPGSDSWFDLTKQYFIDEGWNCIVEAPSGYRTNKHETRQEVMNAVFEGGRKDLPIVSFNDAECTNTILVLQTTEVDSEGKKVKTAEKNPNFPQEQAPHAGDTVDYYIYMKYVVKKHRKKKGSRKVEAMETV